MKRAFLPKHDAFVFFDYKAVEYRLLAFYLHSIGYPEMAEAFKNGLDPHQETATDLGVPENRDFGKTFNFMSIYGGGVGKIAEMLEGIGKPVTKKEAQALYDRFHELRPGVRALSWTQKWAKGYTPGMIELVLEERGHIKTLWGRHLRPELPHKALNALIQGCAADLMRSALVKVHAMLQAYQSQLVLTVHDELVLDCIADEIPVLASLVPKYMDHEPITKVVPVTVDIEWSQTNWAEKEAYGQ